MTPFQIFAVVQVATSFMGYLGSRQQMQNMAVAAKWDKYHDEIRRKYNRLTELGAYSVPSKEKHADDCFCIRCDLGESERQTFSAMQEGSES